MKQNVERSSNVLIADTPSTTGSAGWGTGLRQRTVPCDEEERVHSAQWLRDCQWRKRPPSLRRRFLSHLLGIIDAVIDEGRIVLQRLARPALSYTRLECAFFEILEEITRDARPPFRIVVTGQPKTLSSAIEEQVYMIQREMLINAIRHSDATSIEAEVEFRPRLLRVVIRDNGCGFEPKMLESRRGLCSGLRTIVEQAKAMGAQLQIWSKPGSGTEVELSLPFHPRSLRGRNP